jgi:hypothetical protein
VGRLTALTQKVENTRLSLMEAWVGSYGSVIKPTLAHDLRLLLSERASLQERLAKALGALERISGYAQHDNDCGANLNEPCDCGYSNAARLASQVHAELTSKTVPGIEQP